MAVKKAEISNGFTEALQTEADCLEKLIDKHLKEKYSGNIATVMLTEGFPNEGVRNELERRYNKAGWVVKFDSDQRDAWIELS